MVVGALIDAEHVELVLVPAADDVEAEAAAPDVIGGDELLGGVDRWTSSACTVPKMLMRWVCAKSPQAQVTVSQLAPSKSVSPP